MGGGGGGWGGGGVAASVAILPFLDVCIITIINYNLIFLSY